MADLPGVLEEELHRRRGVPALGITPWQLRGIRERVKDGAIDALEGDRDVHSKDAQMTELEREVERTSKALREVFLTFPWVAGR